MTAVLVGDVGGTNARFAIVDPDAKPLRIERRLDLPADEFASFDAALGAYLDQLGREERPRIVAIGVAGPVTAGAVEFTNRDWRASEQDLRKAGFECALLINDFAAAAFSVAVLDKQDFHAIGPELPGIAEEPITILGAGTGFGVSCLARYRHLAIPVATEGGHVGFAPQDDAEIAVLCALSRRFGRVSIERILSGPGLENLHGALEEISGRGPPALSAADIAAGGASGDAGCSAALEMFCAIFGAVAGDFALAHGARGGVFIAGGIARKIEPLLRKSKFRRRFESKGRLSNYLEPIPTRLILNEDAAFLGAALAGAQFGSRRN
ncbi:MAG: glucokinase [Rhizomicrobium sp.]